MPDRRALKVLVLAAPAMLMVLTTSFSTAAFTSTSSSTATVRAASDWTPPTVGLSSLGSILQGSIMLTATASDAEGAVSRVVFEYRRTDSGAWTSICERTTGPYVCTWNTTGLEGTYEVRARATDQAGNASTSPVRQVTLDNTLPTVTMTDPGSPLSGTRTFAATATDPSGITAVVLQHAVRGSGAWATLCTPSRPASGSTWSCSVDTTTLPNGDYDLRAVATDAAGLVGISAEVGPRRVDNTVTSVVLNDPGAVLAGSVNLTATASSTAGVTSVRFQRSPAGASTWTDICTDTSSPYACAWSTTGVADGLYDLRAVLTDGSGRTTTSATVTSRRVQNVVLPAPTGLDVQITNGGGKVGMIDAGDVVTFTYAGQLDLSTVLAGWTGGPTSATFRFVDVAETETVEIVGTNLGLVRLNGNYSKKDRSMDVPSTMTAITTTVGGQVRTVVTVTVGTLPSGYNGTFETVTSPTTATWTPSSAVKDVLGRAVGTTVVTEGGAADVDF